MIATRYVSTICSSASVIGVFGDKSAITSLSWGVLCFEGQGGILRKTKLINPGAAAKPAATGSMGPEIRYQCSKTRWQESAPLSGVYSCEDDAFSVLSQIRRTTFFDNLAHSGDNLFFRNRIINLRYKHSDKVERFSNSASLVIIHAKLTT